MTPTARDTVATDASTICALDFETFYDDEYGLRTMSTWNYIHDERFDAYLVSFYGLGVEFVGHPSKAPWHLLTGKTVVAHNASFDELVFRRLQETGVIPAEVKPALFLCTADLVAYLGCKRDLKTACKELLGLDVSKQVRSNMKGKNYQDAVLAGMEDELLDYGMDDSIHCHDLAVKYLHLWPEAERQVSKLNRESGWVGVQIDKPLVEEALVTLKQKLADIEATMPWIDEGKKPLSIHAIREQGRKDGIPVPASLAKDSPEVIEWQATYEKKFPWVNATGEYRSVNTLLKRVENVASGIRDDGSMAFQMKYFGATTGRFSGGGDSGGKMNMQNMPRAAMFGVDLRHMFIARPGKVFVMADYSQIEARLLLWRVGDTHFLDLIEELGNIYIAYAKKAWGQDIKKGTKEYQLAKASVLLLGYQGAWRKFQSTAAKPPYNMVLTDEESQNAVNIYREGTPLVVDHWRQHQQWLLFSANHNDATHEVELLSGRNLAYHKPKVEMVFSEMYQRTMREVTVNCELGGHRTRLHSGILTNNEIQGMARDILRDAWVALTGLGYKVLWTIHDELVIELDESSAEDEAVRIVDVMKTSSPWAVGCPLDAETVISKSYCK